MCILIGLTKEIQNFTYPSGHDSWQFKKKKTKQNLEQCAHQNQIPTLPQSLGDRGAISMFTFQRDGSPVLEEDIPWIVKLAKDWEKIYIYFKKEQKEFTVVNFLK